MKTPNRSLLLCGLLLAVAGFAPGCATTTSGARSAKTAAAVATVPIYFDASSRPDEHPLYLRAWQTVFVGQDPQGPTLRVLAAQFSSVKGSDEFGGPSAQRYYVEAELVVNGRSIVLKETQETLDVPSNRLNGRASNGNTALVAWTAEALARKARAHL